MGHSRPRCATLQAKGCVTYSEGVIFVFMPTKLIRKQFLLTIEENALLEKVADRECFSVSNLTRIRHGLKPLEVGRRKEKEKAPHRNRKPIQPK